MLCVYQVGRGRVVVGQVEEEGGDGQRDVLRAEGAARADRRREAFHDPGRLDAPVQQTLLQNKSEAVQTHCGCDAPPIT